MKSAYNGVAVPGEGKAIGYAAECCRCRTIRSFRLLREMDGKRYLEASRRVFDAAVEKAYGGKRRVAWFEVFAERRRSRHSSNGCRTTRWKRRGIFA